MTKFEKINNNTTVGWAFLPNKKLICHPELTRKSVELVKRDFLFLLGVSGSGHRQGAKAMKCAVFTLGGRRPLLNSDAQHTLFTTAKDGRRPLLNLGFGKAAFTLAEVLITLAIIGIVAALTMPSLVQSYKKQVVETKLRKVYSVMNNAIRLSEVDNGPTTTWDTFGTSYTTTATYDDILAWYNKYLAKYLKTIKVEQQPDSEKLLVYLSDGSCLLISNWIYDINYYTECSIISSGNAKPGTNGFPFRFQPNAFPEHAGIPDVKYTVNPYFEPYTYAWDGTMEGAKYSSIDNRYGCYEQSASLCTKLIQLNGWKIPDDYPYKF